MICSFDWYAVYVNEYLLCTRNPRMFGFVGPFFLVQPTQFKRSTFLGLRTICKLFVSFDKAYSNLSSFHARRSSGLNTSREIRKMKTDFQYTGPYYWCL